MEFIRSCTECELSDHISVKPQICLLFSLSIFLLLSILSTGVNVNFQIYHVYNICHMILIH
jgi:hypothetical protein